jgi:hypothetical protein
LLTLRTARLSERFPGRLPSQTWKLKKRLRCRFSDLSKREIAAICLDFDFAVLEHLEWFERREKEVDLVEAPKSKQNLIPVPRYQNLEELLALDIEDDVESPGTESSLSGDDINRRAKELLRDREAFRRFLREG